MLQSLYTSIDITESALNTQRTRLNVISNNIANAETTRTAEGGPYRRQVAVQASGIPGKTFSEIIIPKELGMEKSSQTHRRDQPFKEYKINGEYGVHVDEIAKDPSPFRLVYDPYHPDANADGYVAKPNVDVVQEMTELVAATRDFEANVTVINSTKDMIRKALKI